MQTAFRYMWRRSAISVFCVEEWTGERTGQFNTQHVTVHWCGTAFPRNSEVRFEVKTKLNSICYPKNSSRDLTDSGIVDSIHDVSSTRNAGRRIIVNVQNVFVQDVCRTHMCKTTGFSKKGSNTHCMLSNLNFSLLVVGLYQNLPFTHN